MGDKINAMGAFNDSTSACAPVQSGYLKLDLKLEDKRKFTIQLTGTLATFADPREIIHAMKFVRIYVA